MAGQPRAPTFPHNVDCLFRDLAMARADDSLRKLLYRLSRVDLLIVDDWAMAPLADGERREFRRRAFWKTPLAYWRKAGLYSTQCWIVNTS